MIWKGDDASEAIRACSEALRIHSEDVNVLCDRADAYINNENYEEGLPYKWLIIWLKTNQINWFNFQHFMIFKERHK